MNVGDKVAFTSVQKEIITTKPNNYAVFAAPGSGKTTVLTHHIAYQIKTGQLQPAEIMAMTFTRQAAVQMKTRIHSLLMDRYSHLQVMRMGTFHSQWFRLLLEERPDIPVLLSPREQFLMMEAAIVDETLHSTITMQEVKRCLHLTEMVQHAEVSSRLSRHDRSILNRYQKKKRHQNRWDFEDILLQAQERIANVRDVKGLLPVRYLLIDEFQDTNFIQWDIIRQMQRRYDVSLFVVGDDDQSIYGFRGASPKWFLEFSTFARTIMLETNFRSDTRIIEAASSLIEKNVHRAKKNIVSSRSEVGFVGHVRFATEAIEAKQIYELILQLSSTQPTWKVVLLSRTRAQLYQVWKEIHGLHQNCELRTCHEAKGREWDVVIVLGAIESNPYLAKQPWDIEEERRLFYVSLTRARHICIVSSVSRCAGRSVKPSLFISEANLPLVSWPISLELLVKES